ncbi:DUF3078 domain-containing protein [Balneola sp. MJW-20]|uniref:DUF3078 domain-containing protein n=1 Tax=Gracilimonas aurantiaca TaxID=3234185 RepID=UPI0034675A36
MKRYKLLSLFAVILFTASQTVNAQSITVPDTLDGWKTSWLANLNGAQAAYSNWAAGGVNSLSGNATTVYTSIYRQNKFGYAFRVNLKYGQSKIENEGVRKTDDLILIRNQFTYKISNDGKWAALGGIHIQTQFDDGFEFADNDTDPDVLVSKFLAPLYLIESAGIEYRPAPNLAADLGLGLKQTIVRDTTLADRYGVDAGEKFRSEAGLTFGLSYEKEVATNILYTGSFSSFSNFKLPLSSTDLFWSNELVGQINSIVSASLQFELRYDDDFSNEVQLKQVLSAGVSVSLY